MDATKRYALSAQAAIRPEKFGGLAYRYDNRRLYFLHSKPMADFVAGLDGSSSLDASIDAFLAAHRLSVANKPAFLNAVEKLEKLEVVCEL